MENKYVTVDGLQYYDQQIKSYIDDYMSDTKADIYHLKAAAMATDAINHNYTIYNDVHSGDLASALSTSTPYTIWPDITAAKIVTNKDWIATATIDQIDTISSDVSTLSSELKELRDALKRLKEEIGRSVISYEIRLPDDDYIIKIPT